jgi:hypothetical protein
MIFCIFLGLNFPPPWNRILGSSFTLMPGNLKPFTLGKRL